jgi:hypothetical protein
MHHVPNHKAKKYFLVGAVLILDSFAVSATLSGCSAWTTSASPQNSTVTHFGYAGSPLISTLVPANPTTLVSSAYFGMTIHRLVYNPLSPSLPITPFPSFPFQTLRLWDVVNWTSL